MVNDHYKASQKSAKEESPTAERAGRSGRRAAGEPEDPAHVATTSSSQKPRRTPKPTPQRLAAEEEAAARRQAKANQSTPKSAKAKTVGKAPPSPPPPPSEWTSSARKRSRRLFDDTAEQEPPRYRSPIIDRWRGRHNTDVDEGVDALLSLASGAHNLDERPGPADAAAPPTADAEVEAADAEVDGQDPDALHGAPKRARVKGAGRGADALPVPAATGLRSPRGRPASVAAAAAAAAVPTTSGRAASSGRAKKDQRGSPSTSQQRGSDGGGEGVDQDAPDTAAAGEDEAHRATANGSEAEPAPSPEVLGPSGRPVRKRKPSAIAMAAAAAAADDDEYIPGLGRPARGHSGIPGLPSSALAPPPPLPSLEPAVASGAGTDASPTPPPMDGRPQGPSAGDLASSTAALLATVAPVRTRGATRSGGPPSRRAGERAAAPVLPPTSAAAAAAAAATAASGEEGLPDEEPAEQEEAAGLSQETQLQLQQQQQLLLQQQQQQQLLLAPLQQDVQMPLQMPLPPQLEVSQAQALLLGRGRGLVTAPRATPPPVSSLLRASQAARPPQGRQRRRKSQPERLPPMWESLYVPAPPPAGAMASAAGAGPSAEGAGPAAGGMTLGEAQLRHCLSPRVRRWCMYEFLYSAIDRPWFMRNELQEFCSHMQLPTTKLTRLEWSVLRGALGRPRRLSLAFLREERLRLEGYREHARLRYEEVAMGLEVPPDMPRQLRVGQHVTARHPQTRQLHDGVILTVKGRTYRVQFHRSDLMTEAVPDTDIMPLDPHEALPPNMTSIPPILNGRLYDPNRNALRGPGGPLGLGLGPLGALGLPGGLGSPGLTLAGLGVNPALAAAAARQPGLAAGRALGPWGAAPEAQMVREADAEMVAEVQRALEVKESLVARLATLNEEAARGLHTDENGGRTEHFQLQYTGVVLQLKETNTVLEAALGRLQARQAQVSAGLGGAAGAVALPDSLVSALIASQGQAPQPAAAAAAAPAMAAAVGAPPPAQPSSPTPPPAASPQAQAPAAAPPAAASPLPHARAQPPTPSPVPGSKTPTPLPMVAPNAPLVVPPMRPSTAMLPGAGAAAATAVASSSPEQLVESALAEARGVVGICRARGAADAAAGSGGAGAEEGATGAGGLVIKPDPSEGAVASTGVVPRSEEEVAESRLREVIETCVGLLFTIQRCSAGSVPAATVGDALDLAVDRIKARTEGGSNKALFGEIASSVGGLKALMTKHVAGAT
ncbi:hypothetical protein HYH03_006683 [Edaphochlamys debaryana]|uniref:DIRP domain-containing protein n=1 Tax=Edaphochlamys debaryana TaxID=47281 RepID=A0A836C0N4_9CHLO|nr:hypothetical protein HYH03_006683 [Edaphochlamys debaryana]|eukprot:KAG2495072.1 hypothetical protein HYH03_006683 [Edaphochlamys debaryana]